MEMEEYKKLFSIGTVITNIQEDRIRFRIGTEKKGYDVGGIASNLRF